MTKDYLAKYVFLESHIKSIRRRLKYFKEHPLMAEHGVVTGSMNQFPYTQCRFVVSGVHVKSDEERKKVVSQLLVDLKGHERLYLSYCVLLLLLLPLFFSSFFITGTRLRSSFLSFYFFHRIRLL